MNLSPTTQSPSPVYGIQSIQENRDESETNQRFSHLVFKSPARSGAYQTPVPPSDTFRFTQQFFTFLQRNDLASGLTNVQNLSELDKAERQGGVLSMLDKQRTRWQLLKKLDGTVISVTKESFTVHLRENQTDVSFIEAEIDLSELPEQERPLAVQGASLVWTISHYWQGGTMKRESSIYFRRLPDWTTKEAAKAEEQVRQITDAIRWE